MPRLALVGLTICLIGLMLWGAGRRAASEPPEPQPVTIVCHLFYRDSPAVPPGPESTLTLTPPTDRQSARFETLEFSAQYQDDPFEGRSLFIAVTAVDSNQQLTGQLYQMDRQQGTRNQFQGGHGFTGLAYVYHPSSAELQYFCDSQTTQP